MTEVPDRTSSAVVLRAHRTEPAQPFAELLEVVPVELPPLAEGQVRVANELQQVIAATGELMVERPRLPLPRFEIGSPLYGPAVGRVVESRASGLPVGTTVLHGAGWRAHSTLDAAEAYAVPDGVFPGPEHLLNQGVPAYHGMVDIAQVGEGDVVLVSGAAGGVGSMAAQVARLRGAARVVGVAGGPEKCRYLVEELGLDAAIDYRSEDLDARLDELAPEGVSVFFDTVGGLQFEAAVRHAAPGARFALCGVLSDQLGGDGGFPRLDLMTALVREIQIRPFSTRHTPEQVAAWNEHYTEWFAQGRIRFVSTVLDGGLERVVTAQDELRTGVHRGNVLVRLR